MSAAAPMFTVLMCAQRDDAFVMPAIASVLAQTDPDFEFVIVLNACPDVLHQRVQALDDPRIRVLRTDIAQLGFNLNHGLVHSRGDYIVRFDADDLCHPQRLAQTRMLIARHPGVDVVAGSCRRIAEDGRVLGQVDVGRVANWRHTLHWRNPFVHPATAIRRTRLLQLRGYAGGLRSEDYDLWLRLADAPDAEVVTSSLVMIDYRVSDQQASGSRLGYAEVAGYMLRTLLMRPSLGALVGVLVATMKTLVRGGRR